MRWLTCSANQLLVSSSSTSGRLKAVKTQFDEGIVRCQLQLCGSPSSVSEQVKVMKLVQVPDKRLLFTATVPLIFRCASVIRHGAEGRESTPKLENNYTKFSLLPSAPEKELQLWRLCWICQRKSLADLSAVELREVCIYREKKERKTLH